MEAAAAAEAKTIRGSGTSKSASKHNSNALNDNNTTTLTDNNLRSTTTHNNKSKSKSNNMNLIKPATDEDPFFEFDNMDINSNNMNCSIPSNTAGGVNDNTNTKASKKKNGKYDVD